MTFKVSHIISLLCRDHRKLPKVTSNISLAAVATHLLIARLVV